MSPPTTSVLAHLDAPAVSARAKKEARNREVHLPPVSTYRWWARRTEAVNGAVLDSASKVWGGGPRVIADPFAGGGVIPLAALMRGHEVYAQEINPWAVHGLRVLQSLPDPNVFGAAAETFSNRVASLAAEAYRTKLSDGSDAQIAHTFRVAVAECTRCKASQRLFPHALVTVLRRKDQKDKQGRRDPRAFLCCSSGHLFVGRWDRVGRCPTCSQQVDPGAVYLRNRVAQCGQCGHAEDLSKRALAAGLTWQVVLIDRVGGGGREIWHPTEEELELAGSGRWQPKRELGIIPAGQETRVLLRHGFRGWADLYPPRQRFVTEMLLEHASDGPPEARAALELAVLGSTEMAGLCSRWDRWYLKSFEAMVGHRFNFTTLTVEPNVWGTRVGRGTVRRRLRSFANASAWMKERCSGRAMRIQEGSSERMALRDRSVDLILTDPPYHDDVQYSELSMPLRAWAGLPQANLPGEAVVNPATGQNSAEGEYRDLLAKIFSECCRVLKADGHLVFSFANREPRAWIALFEALECAGLQAVGYTVLHSENETDQSKRGVTACTRDLILDLIPASVTDVTTFRPEPVSDPEGVFVQLVGDAFLRVGSMREEWAERLQEDLRETLFLRGSTTQAPATG